MSPPTEPEERRQEKLANLHVVRHPLAGEQLARLRDAGTQTEGFRRALHSLSQLLACEATRRLPVVRSEKQTPNGPARVEQVELERVTVVVILRSGAGMLDAVLQLMPAANVGYVGVERDAETKQPREYFVKLPPDRGGDVFVLDPMIATGGTATHTLGILNAHGVEDARIRFIAAVTAPDGVRRLLELHPGVPIFAAALDSHLNEAKEVVPGVGDVGDRLFGAA